MIWFTVVIIRKGLLSTFRVKIWPWWSDSWIVLMTACSAPPLFLFCSLSLSNFSCTYHTDLCLMTSLPLETVTVALLAERVETTVSVLFRHINLLWRNQLVLVCYPGPLCHPLTSIHLSWDLLTSKSRPNLIHRLWTQTSRSRWPPSYSCLMCPYCSQCSFRWQKIIVNARFFYGRNNKLNRKSDPTTRTVTKYNWHFNE